MVLVFNINIDIRQLSLSHILCSSVCSLFTPMVCTQPKGVYNIQYEYNKVCVDRKKKTTSWKENEEYTREKRKKLVFAAVTTAHGAFGYVKLTSWNDMLCLWYDTWDVSMTQKKKSKQNKNLFCSHLFFINSLYNREHIHLISFFVYSLRVSGVFTGLESCHVSKCLFQLAVK